MKEELCIMPEDDNYKTTRFRNSERHEIFGASNRNKSIEDGLIVFLTREQHRGNGSVHLAPKEWLWLKEEGQKAWQNHYGKTKYDFIKRYGRSYL